MGGFAMNVYTTDKIRNVVLLGHGGSGKTSLVEAMAYLAGMTTRMGKVADGNTISDYDKEETKRLFSINTSVIPVVWGDRGRNEESMGDVREIQTSENGIRNGYGY